MVAPGSAGSCNINDLQRMINDHQRMINVRSTTVGTTAVWQNR